MSKVISINKRNEAGYPETIKTMKFSVFMCPLPMETNEKVYKPVIILKDQQTKLIVWITDYADYITYYPRNEINVGADNKLYVGNVAKFLTWVFIDNYDRYRITTVENITIDMAQAFLDEYASTMLPNGRYPRSETIGGYRTAISIFLNYYSMNHKGKCKIKPGELIIKSTTFHNGHRIPCNEYILHYKVWNHDTGLAQLERDIPFSAAPYFVKAAELYDPELRFAIILQMYAGLREGEICNMYQGIPGIRSSSVLRTMVQGECSSIELVLKQDMLLRSDGIDQGSIKKKRNRPVPQEFTEIVNEAYEYHMKLISGKPCEDYAPMFLNKQKNRTNNMYMAMTKATYRMRLKRLLERHIIPAMLNSNDENVVLYAESLKMHTFGAHAFRHLFTVYLVVAGYGAHAIADFRGDKNVNSANDYLRKKGELDRQFHESATHLGKMIGKVTKL